MKLTYFRGPTKNFGDELNPYMWPRLLPAGFLDDDETELFLGIGSILWNYLARAPRKVVMGSGYGGYTDVPDIHDGSWNIGFVRGPRTAAMLGLHPDKVICDSAILLRRIDLPAPAEGIGTAFMPHYHSLSRGPWQDVCRLAGIRLIDPRDPVEKVIAEIRGARILIAEAMHGAIVADALRTPWLAVRPIHPENRMKWLDWAESLGLSLRSHALWPSSLLEFYIGQTGGRRYYEGRATRISESAGAAPLNKAFRYLAAQQLRSLSEREPQLSSDGKVGQLAERAAAVVDRFVEDRMQLTER